MTLKESFGSSSSADDKDAKGGGIRRRGWRGCCGLGGVSRAGVRASCDEETVDGTGVGNIRVYEAPASVESACTRSTLSIGTDVLLGPFV